MFSSTLKRFLAVIVISAFAFFANAQQVHFIYLQTEGGQPFYVKVNNKVLSSSQTGYLILSNLADGDYNLKVGFPKNEFPEENFQISINKKNQGFLLKNFGGKGWGLFNMESYNVVMGGNTNSPQASQIKLQDDPFSKMLANVVKDSSILQKNEPEKETPAIGKIDSSTVVAKVEKLLPSAPSKLLSKKNNDGMEMVYADSSDNKKDTIRIFIPIEKPIKKNSENNTVQIEKPIVDSTKNLEKNSASAVDTNLVKTNSDTTALTSSITPPKNNPVENTDTLSAKKHSGEEHPKDKLSDSLKTEKKVADDSQNGIVVLPKVVKSSTINSDCKAFADDEDFLKLRKKMASENTDDNMIKAAKKAFHSKCFSTEQIKNLSFLFLTDEGKYMFFDAAYAYAADSDQYPTLQSQLTDSYYANRFKAMIHK